MVVDFDLVDWFGDLKKVRLYIATLIALVILIAGGCHKDPASSVKPVVTNERDNFHFRLSDVTNHDTLLVYYWQMDGTTANVDQLASIQGGSVSILVRDGNISGGSGDTRQEMYQTDMLTNGAFQSNSGQPGSWQIRITMTNFSGLADFRLRRR